jgi:hypothetical protein
MIIDVMTVAKVCHQANKAFCESIGDYSQRDWNDAPQWQTNSAINGVNFQIANPDAPASSSHDSWLEEKRNAGWKWGPIKNEDLKEHPCFCAYDELPPEQQAKDHIFKAVCQALIPFINVGASA